MNYKKLNIIIVIIYAILVAIGVILLINEDRMVKGIIPAYIINIDENNKATVECNSSSCFINGDRINYTVKLPIRKIYEHGDYINIRVSDNEAKYVFYDEDLYKYFTLAILVGSLTSLLYGAFAHFLKKRIIEIICAILPLITIPCSLLGLTAFIYTITICCSIPFLIIIIATIINNHKHKKKPNKKSSSNEFESIYEKLCIKYQDIVDVMSAEYKKMKKHAFIVAIIVFIINTMLSIVIYSGNQNPLVLLIIPISFFIALAIYGTIVHREIKASPLVDENMVSKIYDSIFKEMKLDTKYISDKGISEDEYNSGYFNKPTSYHSSTSFEGTINKYKYTMSHILSRIGRGEDQETDFIGYLLDIDLVKNYDSKVRITGYEIEPITKDTPVNISESITKSIRKELLKVEEHDNTSSDVTIVDNKLFIRVFYYNFEKLTLDNLLDKKTLLRIYNDMTDINDLASKILDKFEK